MFGPKLALFFVFNGIWGTIFLGVMGVFFNEKSYILLDDLPVDLGIARMSNNATEYGEYMDGLFVETAMNCWFGAAFALLTAALGAFRFLCVKGRMSF